MTPQVSRVGSPSRAGLRPRRLGLALPILVFAVSLLFMLLCMNRTVDVYDEGIILTGAMRIAAGDMVHRDFYANYGPGQFYLLAQLFKWLGSSIAVERLWDLFNRAGIVTVVYMGARRVAPHWTASTLAAACLLWLSMVGNNGYPIYPALLLSLAGTLLVVASMAKSEPHWHMLMAGTLVAGAALFRYDIGFFAGIANSAAMLMTYQQKNKHTPGDARALRANLALYAIGSIVPILLLLLSYRLHGAWNGFMHDVIVFPAEHYAATRALPFPSLLGAGVLTALSQLAVYLPLLLCFWVIVMAWVPHVTEQQVLPQALAESRSLSLALALLGLAFYAKGVVRVSIEHTQPGLIPAVMALAGCFTLRHGWRNNRLARLVSTGVLVCVVLSASSTAYLRIRDPARLVWAGTWIAGHLKSPEGLGIERNPPTTAGSEGDRHLFLLDPNRAAAVDYLVRHTHTGERIYVGAAKHDKIFVNNAAAYFLTQRLPATHWHQFDPDLQNSSQVQAEIIKELETTKTRYLWLESTWDNVSEPNTSAVSSGVVRLDQYIGSNYRPERTFGSVTIVRRIEDPQ